MAKGNSAVNIPCSSMFDFYKKYLMFIKPLNPISKLGDKHLEILAALLVKRYEICKSLKDESLIPKLLFSTDVRDAVRTTCNISIPNYYNVVAMFKKIGIIKDNDLDKKLLPDLTDNKFLLQMAFTINESK
jgi:hypothetical protein